MLKFKNVIVALSALALSTIFSVTAYAGVESPNFNLILNGKSVVFTEDNKPINIEGRTLLQLKTMFDLINEDKTGSMDWNEKEQLITMTKGDKTVKLWIGSSEAYVNGEKVVIESAKPVIYNDRTYVPLRFVANAFDMTVNWNEKTSTAGAMEDKKLDELIETIRNLSNINEAKVSMDMKLFMGIDYSLASESEKFSMDMDMNVRQDIKNKFQYIKALTKRTSGGSSYGEDQVSYMEQEEYDDGVNTYSNYEGQFYKSESYLAYQENPLSVFSLGIDFIGNNVVERDGYAALLMETNADGNKVIAGDIVIDKAKSQYIPFEFLGVQMDLPEYVYYKFTINKENGLIMSMYSSFNKYDYFDSVSGLVEQKSSYSVDAPIINIGSDANFESVVPADIKAGAIDFDAISGEIDTVPEPETTKPKLEDLNLDAFNLEGIDLEAIKK